MSYYIDTTDYMGNRVTCTRNQWFGHITSGHAIMSGNKAAVEETVKTPDTVYEAATASSRKVFFKKAASATYSTALTTKVIVEYNEGTGEIVTAFPIRTERGGIGNVIYPESV